MPKPPGSIDRGVEQRHALSLRHFRLANGVLYPLVRNPLQRGHRFRRKAESNPVITDSR